MFTSRERRCGVIVKERKVPRASEERSRVLSNASMRLGDPDSGAGYVTLVLTFAPEPFFFF